MFESILFASGIFVVDSNDDVHGNVSINGECFSIILETSIAESIVKSSWEGYSESNIWSVRYMDKDIVIDFRFPVLEIGFCVV